MSFTPEEIEEFKTEALDLLDHAEKCLLGLDAGADFRTSYDGIFRAFHNLKGAAGMMDLSALQSHTHELETLLVGFKDNGAFTKCQTNFFLRGIDGARALLNGESLAFNYEIGDASPEPAATQVVTPTPEDTHDLSAALGEFFAESGEIIDRADQLLRRLENGDRSPELINDLYRETHSLKGTAYLFGFNAAGDLAHAMESGLELVRSGERTLSAPLMQALFEGLRGLEQELQSQQNNESNPELAVHLLQLAKALKQIVTPAETLSVSVEVVSVPDATPAPVKSPEAAPKETEANSTIRVPVALLDHLMTLVGEMVLVRNQVVQVATKMDDPECLNISKRLNVVTSEIQAEMMKTRMQPVGNILTKFHRVVRDLSLELKKDIHLDIEGGDTELDKSLLEAIKDPLTHIVRNSCDHGIERPDVRTQSGKSAAGHIAIRAFHEGGQVIVEIIDDGKGLNPEVLVQKAIEKGILTAAQATLLSEAEVFALIFAPGFSTAAAVTNVSGRGVGMDVVRTNIERIGGSIELASQLGRGTTTRLKIPLTLAIVPALIVKCQEGRYAIPQVKLEELVRIDTDTAGGRVESLQGAPVYRLRGQILPLVDLGSVLGLRAPDFPRGSLTIAVLTGEHGRFGLLVDEVQDTGDIVVKPINRLLKSLHVYSGATIMGDGSIAMILDVNGIAKAAQIGSERRVGEDLAAKRRERQHRALEQDFLLVRLHSPTLHAILLNYVHRLEEFRRDDIELSGQHRVVRYGTHILPVVSASEALGYGRSPDEFSRERIPVIVVQKGGQLYGLAITEIMDTFRTETEVDIPLVKQNGIFGNLNLPDRLVVAVDPFELIDEAFPHAVAKNPGLSAADPALPDTKARILVAEDTSFFRRAFLRVLTEAGHDVTVAEDGKDALEILERGEAPFDIVISDIEMPRMNGFDLARAIRDNPRLRAIPLMAVSSRADERSTEKGLESGFNIYLEKLKPDLLLQGVRQLTKRAS